MDDRIIVDSILKDGRKNLFSLIMKNYGGMVFSKVLGITKNTEMAKDVTQTTFIRAFTSLSTWKGKDLGPWLAAIAAHEALDLIEKYGGVTADALAESGAGMVRYIEDLGYDKLVVSIKSSNVRMNYDAHLKLKELTDAPVHIGITESGTPRNGELKSAIGIGALLLAGIGDTMRVSLTDDPVKEVLFARRILETIGMREKAIDVVSCPTCGRTEIDLIGLANEAEDRLMPIAQKRADAGLRPLKIAVMGCAVNGPGESREADYGIAGVKGEGLVFSHGEILEKVEEDRLIDRLIELVEADGE